MKKRNSETDRDRKNDDTKGVESRADHLLLENDILQGNDVTDPDLDPNLKTDSEESEMRMLLRTNMGVLAKDESHPSTGTWHLRLVEAGQGSSWL